MNNELVPVYETSTGEKVVYGTELYNVLGIRSNYRDWVKNRLNNCEAVENEDFQIFAKNLAKGRPSQDHIIKLDRKDHTDLIRDIKRYRKQIDEISQKDIKSNIEFSNFFIESSYSVEGQSRKYLCYLVTKKRLF